MFIGDAELTVPGMMHIDQTGLVRVGCTDELFTRRPCISVKPIGLDRRDRVQLRVKILSSSAHLANEISQEFARNLN